MEKITHKQSSRFCALYIGPLFWCTLALAAPPTIEWTAQLGPGADSFGGPINPSLVAPGQSYMIRARGADSDGNLANVMINKNGQPFAYAGGGDGSTYISNNPSSDSSPATFTAWSIDTNGSTSPVITWTVHPSIVPTIEWTVEEGAGSNSYSGPINPTLIVNGQQYLIRAKGFDPDGNLANVLIDKNGQPFAYAGGGSGTTYISNNPSVDYTPVTYTARAVDAAGNSSPTISLTVYPKRKFVGAYYLSWFSPDFNWNASWGGAGVFPSLGRYSTNQSIGAAHAQRMKEIGVDFIAIDSTNNTTWGPGHPQSGLHIDSIFEGAKEVVSGFGQTGLKAVILLSIANGQGGNQPNPAREQLLTQNYSQASPATLVNFWTDGDSNPSHSTPSGIPSNAGDLFRAKVARVYNEIAYDSSKYFYYDGKPLLLLYTTASGTVYGPDGLNHTPNGKLEGNDLNISIPGVVGSPLITDLFTVRWVGAFVGNSGNPAYVDIGQNYPNQTAAKNGHWSWEDGVPQSWAKQPTGWLSDVFPESVTVTAFSRAYGGNSAAGRLNGVTFLNQWRRSFEVDPQFTMIHTWNEFSNSGDEPSAEYSQSIEANNIFGNSYEESVKNYSVFIRSLRYDIGIYDTGPGVFRLFNRKDDFQASSVINFGFESTVAMYRGQNIEAFSGDFNRDGLFELALRNANDGTVAIRYGPKFTVSTSGDSHAEIVVSLDVGTNWRAFASDFNGDGYCDIGLYDVSAHFFKFYMNTGNYGFSYSHQLAWDAGTNIQIASSDINGDHLSDLIFRDISTGKVTIGLDNGDSLQSIPRRIYTREWMYGSQYQFFVGDFTGDGATEIGLRDASTGRFYFLHNAGAPIGGSWIFSNQTTFDAPSGAQFVPIAGDFR